MNCQHWRDCGLKHGGCCALGLYGGKPSLGICKRCTSQDLPASEAIKPPSIAQKAINLSGAIKRVTVAAVSGERVSIPKEAQDIRLSICNSCEFYKNKTCQKCGCIVRFKKVLATESCPLGRWPSFTVPKG